MPPSDLPRCFDRCSDQVGRYGQEYFDFSAERVTNSVKESLARLQIPYIDIIQCHDIEYGSLDQVKPAPPPQQCLGETHQSLPDSLPDQGIGRCMCLCFFSHHFASTCADACFGQQAVYCCNQSCGNFLTTNYKGIANDVTSRLAAGSANPGPCYIAVCMPCVRCPACCAAVQKSLAVQQHPAY